MTLSSTATDLRKVSRAASTPIGGLKFDMLMAALAITLMGGLYLDGWAHEHGRVDKSFFTPWHAVLYSAFLLNAIALGVVLLLNHRRGRSWLTALPKGYTLSFLGTPLFLVGGVADLIWHTLFGFEVGIAPLLSPTHLLLATSGFLIVSGPIRSAWSRTESRSQQNWAILFAPVLSLTATLSLFTFFTGYASMMEIFRTFTDQPYQGSSAAWGSTGTLFQAVLLTCFVLLAVRRWRLPLGSFTLMFTLNAALMSVMKDQYEQILPALLSGIIADLIYARLQPSPKRHQLLRIFALIVPFVYTLSLFLTMIAFQGTSWTIHLWLGVSVLSGVFGFLMTFLLIPPPIPATAEQED